MDNPEQRICEDIPKLCNGLGDLVGEWTKCAVDAVFYTWVLRSYTRTNKYTAIIIAYVFGAGAMTVSVSPNFGKLFKTQASNEGVSLFPSVRGLHGSLRLTNLPKENIRFGIFRQCHPEGSRVPAPWGYDAS